MSTEDLTIASKVFEKLTVTDFDLAEALPDDVKVQGRLLAVRASEADILADRISSYGNVVNYHYWKRRCEIEQAEDTAAARRYMMLGDRAAEDGNPDGARENYDESWKIWAQILERYPELVDDVMADDLRDVILRYKRVLDQLDEEFPVDFPLRQLVEQPTPGQRPLEDREEAESKPSDESKDPGTSEDKSQQQAATDDKSEDPKQPDDKPGAVEKSAEKTDKSDDQ